jgi:hypothetical protein
MNLVDDVIRGVLGVVPRPMSINDLLSRNEHLESISLASLHANIGLIDV